MSYYDPPRQKYRIRSSHVKTMTRPVINPNMLTGTDYDHFNLTVADDIQNIANIRIFRGRLTIITRLNCGISFDLDQLK